MSDNKIEELMKKHPPRFSLDIHPMRFAKKLSEEEQRDEKEIEVERGKNSPILLRSIFLSSPTDNA